jgi:hypothetical protein
MSDSHENKNKQDENLLEGLGYEEEDLDVTQSPKVFTGLFVSLTVTVALCLVIFVWIAPDLTFRGYTPESQIERTRMPEAPAPLLQSNITAKQDTIDLKKLENEKKNTWGWATQDQRFAKVPVDQAIEKVGSTGQLPRWGQTAQPERAAGTTAAPGRPVAAAPASAPAATSGASLR